MNSPIRFLYPVRIKHRASGKYLYSTAERYGHPGSSGQQMVGTSVKTDANSLWVVKHANSATVVPPVGHVFSHGETIRIEHLATHKNLHSHGDRKSPMNGHQEVTAFGGLGVGDANDDWTLSFVETENEGRTAEVRLTHLQTEKALWSNDVKLKSQPSIYEVACIQSPADPNGAWEIEATDEAPVPVSRVAVKIEVPERLISVNIESTTSASKWLESANRWINSESDQWAWLTNLAGANNDAERRAFQPTAAAFDRAFSRLRTGVREAIANLDNEHFAASLATLQSVFTEVYSKPNGILYSGEPAGIFISEYAEENLRQAATAAAVLIGQNPAVTTGDAARGVTRAYAFLEAENHGDLAAHGRALDEMRQSWQVAANDTMAAAQKTIDVAEDRIKALALQAENFTDRTNNLIAEKTAAIVALEETLREKVSLDRSIEYWTKRAKNARAKAIGFGMVALLVFGASIYKVNDLCDKLFEKSLSSQVVSKASPAAPLPAVAPTTPAASPERVNDPTKKTNEDEPITHQYWRYLVVAVTLTFSFWTARVLVQITMSNLHTYTDANERVTMLQTFLSLMSDKSIAREDIKLILQTVFRPGTTGLIKDETGVQTPLEMILKNVTPSGGASTHH